VSSSETRGARPSVCSVEAPATRLVGGSWRYVFGVSLAFVSCTLSCMASLGGQELRSISGHVQLRCGWLNSGVGHRDADSSKAATPSKIQPSNSLTSLSSDEVLLVWTAQALFRAAYIHLYYPRIEGHRKYRGQDWQTPPREGPRSRTRQSSIHKQTRPATQLLIPQ